jgi:hypothetical protein
MSMLLAVLGSVFTLCGTDEKIRNDRSVGCQTADTQPQTTNPLVLVNPDLRRLEEPVELLLRLVPRDKIVPDVEALGGLGDEEAGVADLVADPFAEFELSWS